jgi:hypothetical protein
MIAPADIIYGKRKRLQPLKVTRFFTAFDNSQTANSTMDNNLSEKPAQSKKNSCLI